MRPVYPHHPPRPAPPAGFLVQKIIACEKRSLPCVSAEWRFPSCASGSVQSVAPCGSPVWSIMDGCRLRITLPVSVCVCDGCGRCSVQSAALEVETDLPRAFSATIEDPRCTLLILPCIRLIRADCACPGCWRVQLAVSLEMYLLRYETLHCGQPQCPPPLPLYPQPIC